MKKLLKQILSEVQGIRKALEPKVTPEPVNYSGQNNDVCNQVYRSSADQKPKLPESINDLYDTLHSIPDFFPPPFHALAKLYHLRKAYWQAEDWGPDWENTSQHKYVIYFNQDKVNIDLFFSTNIFLAFPNKAQTEHFLQHHRALIEQARELL